MQWHVCTNTNKRKCARVLSGCIYMYIANNHQNCNVASGQLSKKRKFRFIADITRAFEVDNRYFQLIRHVCASVYAYARELFRILCSMNDVCLDWLLNFFAITLK